MARYSEEILDEIRDKIDIVTLISRYVVLKKSGKSYKGLCPFHQEKTPSFMVDGQKQMYHCFGCGEGGNIFTFIMKIEKTNFPETVKILANRAGVHLPDDRKQHSKESEEKEAIFNLNKIAADYFQKNLFTYRGKVALQYLIKRGFNEELIKKFCIGYSLPEFDDLILFLSSKKIELQNLFKAGLAFRSNNTKKAIDYFRNRVMFPIFNLQGKIIAFGGRVLDNKLPKYINSPETIVYNKTNSLYGLFQARQSIRQDNQVIIMEGYTDVLIAHQFGFSNAVASLGTALTSQQANLMKRFADEAIIAFDSDAAGENATLRSINIVKKAGLAVKILNLPPNTDPADILLKKGKKYFANLIENSLPLIDYKLSILSQKYNPSHISGKLNIVKSLFEDLIEISSEIELQNDIKKIAEELNLTEESILIDLNRYKKGKNKLIKNSTIVQTSVEATYINAEKTLIGNILQNSDIIEKITSELEVEDFTIFEHRVIFSTIFDLYKTGEIISPQSIINKVEQPNIANLISQIVFKDVISFDLKAVNRSIKAIKIHRLQQKLNKLKKIIHLKEKDDKDVDAVILQEYQETLNKINTLTKSVS